MCIRDSYRPTWPYGGVIQHSSARYRWLYLPGPLIAVLRPIVIYLSVSLALDDSGEQVLVYIEATRGRQLSTLAEDNPKIEVPYNIRMTNCILIFDKVGVLLHYLYFRLWSYLLCMCMHVHCRTYKISDRSMIYKTSCFRFEGMKAIQVMSSNCNLSMTNSKQR